MPASPHHSRKSHTDRETVFLTARGKVDRCRCCGTMHLQFGNASIALDEEDFGVVADRIAHFDRAPERRRRRAIEHVRLDIGETGAAFVFSRDEIAELHRLVAGAQLLRSVSAD